MSASPSQQQQDDSVGCLPPELGAALIADLSAGLSADRSMDLSADPSVLRNLSPAQRQRLSQVLDDYLQQLENGDAPLDTEKLLTDNPTLAEPLANYLGHLETLHEVAAGFVSQDSDQDETAVFDQSQASLAQQHPVSTSSSQKRIGDFLLGDELGRGGMGVVYEATQLSLGRRVALKLLPFAAVLDAKQIARFKNEAQAAAQVNHPNIVPVFAVGAERGVHYYAMQLIEGLPLDRAITELRQHRQAVCSLAPQGSQDSPAAESGSAKHDASTLRSFLTAHSQTMTEHSQTVAQLGIQVALAMHAAHEYGVIHRDIKPSNLLLDEQGKLWVTDFGLARCQTQQNLTCTGDLMGTARYMSPEQAMGKSAFIDQRTDVYSLGITLYELLTLRAAFQGKANLDLVRQVETLEPPTPRSIDPSIPVDLENVILKATSKDREDRYVTAQEFADDLTRFLERKPTVAKPASVLAKIQRWTRRHQTAMLVATAVACCLLVILSISTLMIARARTNAEIAREKSQADYQHAVDVIQFGERIVDEMVRIPGTEQVRRNLQLKQLEFYGRLVRDHTDDVNADVAQAHNKIGVIQASMGSAAESIAAYHAAQDMFQTLKEANPSQPQHARHLALNHNQLGLAHTNSGHFEMAADAFNAAMQLQKELASQHSATTDVGQQMASDLAVTLANQGLLFQQQGRTEDATSALREAIRIQQQVVHAVPKNADAISGLAKMHNNLSGVLQSEPKAALAENRRALKLQNDVALLAPDRAEHQLAMAMTYNNIGAALSKGQSSASAIQAYQHAIEIQTKLVASHPLIQSYQADLALSHNNLALAQSRAARPDADEVVQSFQRAIDLQRKLAERDASNQAYQSTLGGIYNNFGIVLERWSKLELAVEAFRSAVACQIIAVAATPEATSFRNGLNTHYLNQSRVLRKQNQPLAAAKLVQCRRELWPSHADHLASVATELAVCIEQLRKTAQHDAAIGLTQDTLQILSDAVDAGWLAPKTNDWPACFASLHSQPALAALSKRPKQKSTKNVKTTTSTDKVSLRETRRDRSQAGGTSS